MPAGTMRTVSSHTGGQYERGELERNTPYNPDVEVTDSRESTGAATQRRVTGLAAQGARARCELVSYFGTYFARISHVFSGGP